MAERDEQQCSFLSVWRLGGGVTGRLLSIDPWAWAWGAGGRTRGQRGKVAWAWDREGEEEGRERQKEKQGSHLRCSVKAVSPGL